MSASSHAVVACVALWAGATTVAARADDVTPSGDSVPDNLLRIELRLQRPLMHPLAMAHVRLVGVDGETIDGAFLDLPLPGDDGRTITLLLHPGRVKTGVGANLALGRALHAGDDVTLVVDDPQLHAPLHKRWHIVAASTRGLLADGWRLELPRAGSRMPLRVTLGTPLTASSVHWIALRGPGGERLDGVASLHAGETEWQFRPRTAWRAGDYALVVHPRLEDVAGNRPCAPFEAPALSRVDCAPEERRFALRP